MPDVADRIGVGLRPKTLDFVEGELGSGRDNQKVIVETAAIAEVDNVVGGINSLCP